MFENRRNVIIAAIVVVLIIAVVVLVVLNQKPAATKTAPIIVNLNWWNADGGSKVYQNILDDFKKIPGYENVNIKITDISYDENYNRKLLMEFARETAPDIFTLKSDTIPAWREFIAPITNLNTISNTNLIQNYRNDFVDIVNNDTIYRDQIYGITNSVDSLQLYYNEDILNQAGIALKPTNWKEMDEQLRKLNKRQNNTTFTQSGIALGTGLNKNNGDIVRDTNLPYFQDILSMLMFQGGELIFDENTQKSTFNNPKNPKDITANRVTSQNFDIQNKNKPALDAIRFFASFSDPRDNTRFSWSIDSNNAEEAFLQGKVAYMIHYRYFGDKIKEQNSRIKFGVADLPQVDSTQKRNYGTFYANVINKNLETENINSPNDTNAFYEYQVAKNFMYYLSLSSTQEKILNLKGGVPAARKDLIEKQKLGDKTLSLFSLSNLYAKSYYKPSQKATDQIWGRMLYRYNYENIPLEKAVEEAKQEYEALIQRGPTIEF
jgi:ABC-type glycerol-3-phosphate transport system substrate-binding protein